MRLGQIEFFKAVIGEDVMPIEFGAHRTIEDEQIFAECFGEGECHSENLARNQGIFKSDRITTQTAHRI